jgi:hypothetical protein
MNNFRRRTGSILVSLVVTSTSIFAQGVDSTATDSLLIRELERELSNTFISPTPTSGARPPRNLMNPEISVIGDFRAGYSSKGPRNVDAEMHEVETALRSAIDPYARADVFVAIHGDDGEFEFELEEAYLTSLSLPLQLQLKAGKFRSGFGKINRLHPHVLPYVDLPFVYRNFFGSDGLNDQGLSLSWLVPNPWFFQDLTIEVTRGPGENESFMGHESNRLLYVSRVKNFWELNPNATMELGLSGAVGPNEFGRTTLLGGLDATYIWKPLQFNVYRSLTLQAECVFSRQDSPTRVVRTWGGYALAQYRFARRWLTTMRVDVSDAPADPDWNERGLSVTAGWLLTEFQKLEFGLQTREANEMDRSVQAVVRVVFAIGSHGAHEY